MIGTMKTGMSRALGRIRSKELRRVVHGVMTSGVAMGLASVFNYLTIIILTRLATREEVGTFSYIISTATILATLADFGMTNALTRAYHEAEGAERGRLLAMSLLTRGVLSAIAGAVCLLSGNPDLRWVGVLLFLWPGDTLLFFLNARLDFNRAALLRTTSAGLYLGGSILLFVATENPGVAALARGLAFAIVGGFIGWKSLDRAAFRGWTLANLKRHLRRALDYFALTVSAAVFGHIDVLLLSWLMTRDDVGLYRPVFTLAVIPSLLSMVVRVPLNAVVSSGKWTDRRAVLRTVHTLVLGLSVISGFILVVGLIFAEPIVRTVLGPNYAEGATVFRLVLTASAILSVISPYNSFILMKGRVTMLVILALIAMGGLVLLDLLLIPWMGREGAAVARLLVQVIGLAGNTGCFYFGLLKDIDRQAQREAETAPPT